MYALEIFNEGNRLMNPDRQKLFGLLWIVYLLLRGDRRAAERLGVMLSRVTPG
jgi:hypothetical protein